MRGALAAGLVGLALLFARADAGATVTVPSTAEIYSAGSVSPNYGGSLPVSLTVAPGTGTLTFTNVLGNLSCLVSPLGHCITVDGGRDLNDADGTGAAPVTSSSTGAGSISGIVAPGAGYLVGLFVTAGGPAGPAPAALDFTAGHIGTGFTSLSPLLDQVFFIGDGLTGDGSGAAQIFNVPVNAATLFLGVSDSCGYSGGPGCYFDNVGSYSLLANQIAGPRLAPEPPAWALLLAGLAMLALPRLLRRA